jgi:integrase
VGVDIPTPDEIKRIVHAATGRVRPFLVTVIFTGLRSSELRGLRWSDVDRKNGELHVRQRADRYNEIGKPKSESGERVIRWGHSLCGWPVRRANWV